MTTAVPIATAAPLWRRLAALVYDLLAVVAIVMVVGYVSQRLTGGNVVSADGHAIAWWYQPLQGLVVAAYFLASWLRGGQTLGMRPWRIRIVDGVGALLRPGRAVLRLIVLALPLLLLEIYRVAPLDWALWAPVVAWALMLLPTLIDPRRRAFHDIVAGSEIVQLQSFTNPQ
jgi:uncharacterized RDD family membrane protein YckC